jgi:ATP-dependent helicase/nuclease subunit B
MVDSVLTLLKTFTAEYVLIEDLYYILNSQYFAWSPSIVVAEVIRTLQQLKISKLPRVALPIYLPMYAAYATFDHTQCLSTEEWLPWLQQVLQHYGWQYVATEKTEQDLAACWQQVLQQYSLLQPILSAHTLGRAWQVLSLLACNMPFLPENTVSTVQIMGIWEAAGIEFDYLWLTSMHHHNWPRAANPNPLLPYRLQAERQLPHSSSARELQVAEQVLAIVAQAARQEIIVSFPALLHEVRMYPSVLLQHWPPQALAACAEPPAATVPALEVLEDTRALPFVADEPVAGLQFLYWQYTCPFRAFAEARLRIGRLPTVSVALDAGERGQLCHAVLAAVWQHLGGQQQLLALSSSALQVLLERCIDQELQRYRQRLLRLAVLSVDCLQLERQRLLTLLQRWLAVERSRPPFTVAAIEKTYLINLNNLQVRVRVDRIDQIDRIDHQNSWLLIDYKTSTMQDSEQLALQLSLYALASKLVAEPTWEAACALLHVEVVQLRACQFDQAAWQAQLYTLSQAFLHGEAQVLPRAGARTCAECRLEAVCRIDME